MKPTSHWIIVIALLVTRFVHAHEVLHNVERGKAIAVKAYYADGEPLAYSEYQIFSPADQTIPHQKGRTDRVGYLAFVPNIPGAWKVKVSESSGHGFETTVDTTSVVNPAKSELASWAFALRPMVGILVIVALFSSLYLYNRRKGKNR